MENSTACPDCKELIYGKFERFKLCDVCFEKLSQSCNDESHKLPRRPMDMILPNLYVGNIDSARDNVMLKQTGITHIVKLCNQTKPYFAEHFIYKEIDIDDDHDADMGTYFDEVVNFIENAHDLNGIVLIHCAAGQSRSATLAIAYLLNKFDYSYDEAYEYVKNRRPCIEPNPGFTKQLKKYASSQHK